MKNLLRNADKDNDSKSYKIKALKYFKNKLKCTYIIIYSMYM